MLIIQLSDNSNAKFIQHIGTKDTAPKISTAVCLL